MSERTDYWEEGRRTDNTKFFENSKCEELSCNLVPQGIRGHDDKQSLEALLT